MIIDRAKADLDFKATAMANKYMISYDQALFILIEGMQLGITVTQRLMNEVEERFKSKRTL